MIKGPQEAREESRQRGMEEAETAGDNIADERIEPATLKQNIKDQDTVDRGVFREERDGEDEEDLVSSHDDDRVPNLPDYVGEEPKELKHPVEGEDRPSANPELLEDAYSKNDPGVETKK